METTNNENVMKGGKSNTELYIQIALIAILSLVIVFNAGKVYGNEGKISGLVTSVTSNSIGTVSASEIIPKGVPEVYG